MAWDSSFENVPADAEDISQGAGRIRTLKTDTRERAQVESNWGDIATGYTDDGRANPGSARAFAQAAAPTQLLSPNGSDPALGPSGFSAALSTSDNGRLWLDTTDSANVPVLKWWTGTAWQTVQLGVESNRILSINGGMAVWQRDTAATVFTTGQYLADRWLVSRGGAGSPTQEQATQPAASTAQSEFALKFTGDTGTTVVDVSQRIEAHQFSAYNGNISVGFHIFVDNDDDGTQSGTADINIQMKTPTAATDNDFSGGVTIRSTSASVTGLTNSRVVVSGIDVSGYTNIQNGLQVTIQIETGALVSTAHAVYISDIQIERADFGSNFVYRGLAEELPKCQRFYEKTFDYAVAANQTAVSTAPEGALTTIAGIAAGANGAIFTWPFNTPKITSGYTVTTFNPTAAAATAQNLTDGGTETVDTTNMDPGGAEDPRGEHGTSILVTGSPSGVGDVLAIHATADAEL
jgi:hypothetical protein